MTDKQQEAINKARELFNQATLAYEAIDADGFEADLTYALEKLCNSNRITCKDCKHWDERGYCDKIEDAEYAYPDTDAVLAYTRGSNENGSFLITKPDFGCTLGESRE